MNELLERFKQMDSTVYFVIFLVVIIIILLVILFFRKQGTKKLKEQMADLEVDYNSVKSVPLSFKLNKAIALARVNEDVKKEVGICGEDFELIQGDLTQISGILADLDDAIDSGNHKLAKTHIIDLTGTLARVQGDVKKLDAQLDVVLEEEVEKRTKANTLKEEFRNLKERINDNRAQISFSAEAIEIKLKETESSFTTFEEWMFASEFDKAEGTLDSIKQSIVDVDNAIVELPNLLANAQGMIPKYLDEVSQLYSKCRQRGLVIDHLEVPKTLELVSQTLTNDLASIRKMELAEVGQHLEDNKTRLVQLIQQLEREDSATDDIVVLEGALKDRFDELDGLYKDSLKVYDKVSDRFDFSKLKENLENQHIYQKELEVEYADFVKQRKDNKKPSSELIAPYKAFAQRVNALAADIKEISQTLKNVRSDEERAQKQLLKLHLIMNEIQVKIRKHRLPNISNQCDGDIQRAYSYIHSLEELLAEETLNLPLLNATLNEAIDYVYKLYNDVNNTVGMAIMLENTVVFGNRYRSTYDDIDSDLAKAELLYRNGEYTQALTIAIRAIEKIHPGSSEQLIKENSSSVA